MLNLESEFQTLMMSKKAYSCRLFTYLIQYFQKRMLTKLHFDEMSTWMSELIIQFDYLSFKALLFENYTGLESEKMNKNFLS
jgi:hypothetical protein